MTITAKAREALIERAVDRWKWVLENPHAFGSFELERAELGLAALAVVEAAEEIGMQADPDWQRLYDALAVFAKATGGVDEAE
jgi:hypothetical protein